MNYRVSLNKPGGERWAGIDVSAGRTILETALSEGIEYPHGCRSGNCGGCKSHLVSGDVEMAPYSPFALTGEERDRGLILACRSVPWSDCTVQPVEADEEAVHASRRLDCRVAGIDRATHDIRILSLDIESGGPFDFTAGQYAALAFEGLPARDFSMASPPGAARLEFHVRLVSGGQVTRHVMNRLRIGDRVSVNGPMGTAHYRKSHRGPILLVAGGSGLAPIKSIAESALAGGAGQDMFLYFGARAERDVYLEDRFSALAAHHPNLRNVTVLSEPAAPTPRRTGWLADALAADFDDLDGFKAYLAGPPAMVESCTDRLLALGLARRDCHADAFYTEAEKASGKTGRGAA